VRAGGVGGLTRWALWPALLWTAAVFVGPLVVTLAISFTEHGSGALTLDNYIGFVTRSDGAFVGALFNSIEVTAIVTALSVPLAYPLAYVLAYRTPPRWQRVLLVMLILPFWTSYVIRSYSWLVVLSRTASSIRSCCHPGCSMRPSNSATAAAPPCSASSISSSCC
jgi:spermidine/putrescine transport system permease protein